MDKREKAKKTLTWAGGLLVILGLILVTISLSNYFKYNKLLDDGGALKVSANVINYEEEWVSRYRNGKRRRTKECETELSYVVEGTTYSYEDSSCHSDMKTGGTTDIYYVTEDPTDTFFEDDINGLDLFQNIAILVGGAVALVIGIRMSPY